MNEMSQMIYLSYPLRAITPVYGDAEAQITLDSVKSIQRGDSCNASRVGFENHWGTHIDCPAHFFDHGPAVASYPPDFWVFKHPQIIPVDAQPDQIIGECDLTAWIQGQTDLLLLRTGMSQFRGHDLYSRNNPGLAPEIGMSLRRKYPNLRAIGFDFISLGSFQDKPTGRTAHRAFLDPDQEGNPLVIIEDMYLPLDVEAFREVWAMPLIIEGIDSSPATIVGVIA